MDEIEKLNDLRQRIDDTDLELIKLLEKRLNLVKEASLVKATLGASSRSLEREEFLLQDRALKAKEHHLPEGLIEDLLKRLLRESYKDSAQRTFSCTYKTSKPIVLVGGNGGMGQVFAKYFKASEYKVKTLEKDDWENVAEIVKGALLVLICVPIEVTENVIERLAPYLDEETILADITSVKAKILSKMLSAHQGPVLALHPMFGPDIKGMVKQVIVNAGGRELEKSAFVLEQFKIWGAKVCNCEAQEHDKAMGIIQAMRHFTTYCYGLFLANTNASLKEILDLSSPIYHLELLMVGRLFAQDPHLYCDIIMAQEHNKQLIEQYLNCLKEQLEVVANHNKAEFVKCFLDARDYFGEYATLFLKESGQLLARVNDDKR